jgi:hypothetical protein
MHIKHSLSNNGIVPGDVLGERAKPIFTLIRMFAKKQAEPKPRADGTIIPKAQARSASVESAVNYNYNNKPTKKIIKSSTVCVLMINK